ncbi:DUF6434 domain-containing protein [Ruminococcus sp.]|uniref:DUF6434 domain-containing protein n=1 Tax=Ruminococcus sp. TaxID=41978 RepID=UPI0025E6869D|nr:DUF6434 domain-containing protein [Ruminococcus sp.]
MSDRPELSTNIGSATFLEYYYLKEELVAFCRENGLPVSGGKIELTERIAHFLDTGVIVNNSSKRLQRKVSADFVITPSSIIEDNIVCSEKHRAFFKKEIGEAFSFTVPFQKWLKANAGKTYNDAIAAYHQIIAEKKNGKSTIDRQFEYNTYIRDFFADNSGKTLDDAIKCWKYKKSQKGNNQYDRSDLKALEQ